MTNDILCGTPILLDERACARLSLAESYEVPSPVRCKSMFMPIFWGGVQSFQWRGNQRRRYRRRTGWRML